MNQKLHAIISDKTPAALTDSGVRAWFRVGFAATSFLGFGIGALVLGTLVLPIIALVTRSRERRVVRCQRVVQLTFILFHDFMRGAGLIDWNSRAHALRLPAHPVVVVANHPSLLDITVLVSLFGPMCHLTKRTLFRNPLFALLLRWCDQIPSGGGSLYDGVQVIESAVDRLARGHSVLLFPEGARSPPGGMHRFRDGAFEIARRAGVPLLPVLLHVDPPGLYRGLAWYQIPRRTMTFRVELLSQIDVTSHAAISDLRKQLEARFNEQLALKPNPPTQP